MEAHTRGRLISIVRRRDALVGLISQRGSMGAEVDGFALKPVPLERVKEAQFPGREKLLESWRYLAQARAADEETLYHVMVVVMEMVPDLSAVGVAVLAADWGVAPVAAKPTGAHPRAFRGTKYQPPKRGQLAAVDLRPFLCDRASVLAVVGPMRKFLPAVRARLERSGCSPAAVAAIESELRGRYWTMPARFVQCVWPSIRWRSGREVSAHLALYVELDLEHDDGLLASVSRLIAESPDGLGCAWCRLAVVLPPDRRGWFVDALLVVRAGMGPPDANLAGDLVELSELSSDEQFPSRVRFFVEAARHSYSVGYLMAGVRLADRFSPRYRFDTVGRCKDFPERVVERIGVELGEDWIPLGLWESCGRFPGMAEVVERSAWQRFTPEAAKRYFRFLRGIGFSDLPEAALQARWLVLRRVIPRWEACVLDTAEAYQPKAVSYVAECVENWNEGAEIEKRTPALLRLVGRLAAAPFDVNNDASDVFGVWLDVDESALVESVLTAPNRSFQVLERTCGRGNEARLILRGLDTLIHCLEAFAVEAFCREPKRLMKTAEMLGGVSRAVGEDLCRKCLVHPLFDLDLSVTSIRDACAVIGDNCGEKYFNPIPARLKLWLRGEAKLTAGSLARYQRVMSEKILLTRLDLIEQAVLERLKIGFPEQPLTKAGQHALRLLGTTRENRRGLRKSLTAYWSGDREYLAKHPATRAWYQKHELVSREVWEGGVPTGVECGGFKIQIESEPLEVLKLGTYVGSCLGVGGICSDSAIAVLLDVNKQVLYARDRHGRVIARQLVAISDDDQLVCFYVYPLSASPAVKASFRAYDLAFANDLGLALYDSKGSDETSYEVSNVLAMYWWDDGNWDLDSTP